MRSAPLYLHDDKVHTVGAEAAALAAAPAAALAAAPAADPWIHIFYYETYFLYYLEWELHGTPSNKGAKVSCPLVQGRILLQNY